MAETMKALVYGGPEKIALQDVPVPKIIEPDDAIIKVTTSTTCGTQCGECFYCVRGTYSHCTTGSWIFGYMIDGCQAEYVRVPHANLGMFKIPEGLTEEDVLFVGDILSTGYFGAEQACIEPGDTVAVMGSGPVGMCAMATARLWGPSKIVAVDMVQERLDAAVKNGVADIGLNPAKVNVAEALREMTDGRGADRTIEAVGAKGTYELAMNTLWVKNIRISMGLVNANHIPELIRLVQNKKIDMKFLCTHHAPLNDLLKGYDVFGNKKDNVLKWVITPYQK